MVANLFDATFYRLANPDLAAAGLTTDAQLRTHFINFGANEGRAFSSFINLAYYAAGNPDLAAAGLTTNRQLFEHLENFGADEGRRPSVAFSPDFYRSKNPDLPAAGLVTNEQLYNHYKNFGINEGRVASEFFAPRFYLDANPDLRAAGLNFSQALQHFLNFGIRERRLATPAVSPVEDPGSATSTAYGLGALVDRATFVNFVGPTNLEDYYYFTLDKTNNLNLNLSTTNGPAVLRLFADSNNNFRIDPGEELNTRFSGPASPLSLTRTLGAGGYYVDVVTGSSVSTLYTLGLSPVPTPGSVPTDPGNTPGNAFNLGTLSGARVVQEFVGNNDIHDFYRFVLGNISNFNMGLGSASEPVAANLYADRNNNGVFEAGELVTTIAASGSGNGNFNQVLQPGTYFVDVLPSFLGANSNYVLSLSA